jgi:hypothetical protein
MVLVFTVAVLPARYYPSSHEPAARHHGTDLVEGAPEAAPVLLCLEPAWIG